MILNMYSIKDELNGYTTPIPFDGEKHEELAKRYFISQLRNNGIMIGNEKDFSLNYMGTFDTLSGTYIQDANTIKCIMKGGNENGNN